MEQSAGFRQILAPNPSPMTLDGTVTYIVGDRKPVVIDPGPEMDTHIDRILQSLAGATPIALILTHAHPDHVGAAPALAAATGAPIWMAPGALGDIFPIPPVDRYLAPAESIRTDAGSVTVIPTPGHAPEHIALAWRDRNRKTRVFVGDLMMGVGDTALVEPPEGNLRQYLESLDRIQELRPESILPAHGPPISDPDAVIDRYRKHRYERIRQVEGALREAESTHLDTLLEVVYGSGIDPRLRRAAAGSLRAILEFLDIDVDDRGQILAHRQVR